jgi:hypothetical protein
MRKRTQTVTIKHVPIEYAAELIAWGRCQPVNKEDKEYKDKALAEVFAAAIMLYSERHLGKEEAMKSLNRKCSRLQLEENPTFHNIALKP